MTGTMAAWWYGWAITSFIVLMLGSLAKKVPQRLGHFWIFKLMFQAGPRAVVMNLMMAAFMWPVLLGALILLLLDRDDDDFDGFV